MSLRVDQLGKALKVIQRIQETADAVSLVLEIPEALKKQFHYQAGQFVTFFMDINGEQLNRSYSLSTSPLTDKEFKVTVKKVHGGRGSTYLCERVKEGDVLMTAPPAGNFFRPSLEAKGVHYVLIAAGSGITPVFSILKTVLSASTLNHVTLMYCNRTEESIIYRKEIDEWARNHPSRLDVVHSLTKPTDGWTGHTGRLDKNLIGEILEMPVPGKMREYYLCGPKEFMSTVRHALMENGVAKEHIREEDFAISLHKPGPAVNDTWTFIGPQTPAESPEKIIAKINGETFEIPAKQGQSVLETLLEAGAQPPYSCMDGACMACMAKIQEGRVYQEDPGILTDDNIAMCEALTCQAKPLSRIVKLSYDDL
ncbi:MAG: ferredoxin--NADP reductase [Bdellovibrionales bacterium]|nr:ferredoxin--NADP reductase [Bdellovibrionales bacterium]